jgi:hypothetical protein
MHAQRGTPLELTWINLARAEPPDPWTGVLVPQDFPREVAIEALKQDCASDQATILLDRLIASGVLERRAPGAATSF